MAIDAKLKKVFKVTTKHMPDINEDDGYFEYFVDMLGYNDRLRFICDYFTNSNISPEEFLQYRENVKDVLRKEYKSLRVKERLSEINYNYPRTFLATKTPDVNKTFLMLDLSSACYTVCNRFGIYPEKTWQEHLSNFTDNDFLLNHDTAFKYDCVSDDALNPPFSMAYKQTIYDVFNDIQTYVNQWKLTHISTYADNIKFLIEGNNTINLIKESWGKDPIKYFDGVGFHYTIGIERCKSICFANDVYKKIKYYEDIDKGVILKLEHLYREYYPQLLKLCSGFQPAEKDFFYFNNMERAINIKLINE